MKQPPFYNKLKPVRPIAVIVCICSSLLPVLLAMAIKNRNELLFFLLLIFSGWLTWTYIEYFYHRFAMHPKNNRLHSAAAKMHQHHHRSPSVFEVTLFHRILLFIFSSLFFLLAWKWNNYFTLFAGFFWGFAAFCYMHYLLHQRWIKYILPRHHYFHTCHHCKFPDTCFGVTVTWWDYLFCTTPPTDFSISEKAATLYYL